MRKRILIGTLLIVIAGAGLTWQLVGRASSPQMERFLPADTIAFVEAANLSEQALRLVETKAWRVFSEANPELTAGFLAGANYSGLLRADVAAALIRLHVNGEVVRPVAVVLAESDDENFQRNVELFLSTQFSQPEAASVTDYQGVSIVSYGQDQRLHYARVDDLFIFSDRQEGVKEVIDVARGGSESLADNQRLVGMRNRLGYTDGFFGFASGEQAMRTMQSLQAASPSEVSHKIEGVEQALRAFGLDSVAAVGGVSSFEADGLVERLRVETPGGGSGLIRAVLTAPGNPQRVLRLVPGDADHLFVASAGDAVAAYDDIYNAVGQLVDPAHKNRIDEGLADVGVSLRDDILAAFGHELAIVTFPSPERKHACKAFIAELRDPTRFQQSVEIMAGKHQLSVTREPYADQPVMVIRGEKPDHALRMAFIDSFVAISEDGSAIGAVIDAYQSGNTLAASSRYQQAFANRVSAPLFTFYKTNDDVLKLMARTLRYGKGSSTAVIPESGTLFPTALYGVAQTDGLYIESHSPLGTFPQLLAQLVAHVSKLETDK